MDMDFDWIKNWRVVVNVLLSAIIYGGLGTAVVYFASPPDTSFFAKVCLAGGMTPVIAAVQQRLTNKPSTQNSQMKSNGTGSGTT